MRGITEGEYRDIYYKLQDLYEATNDIADIKVIEIITSLKGLTDKLRPDMLSFTAEIAPQSFAVVAEPINPQISSVKFALFGSLLWGIGSIAGFWFNVWYSDYKMKNLESQLQHEKEIFEKKEDNYLKDIDKLSNDLTLSSSQYEELLLKHNALKDEFRASGEKTLEKVVRDLNEAIDGLSDSSVFGGKAEVYNMIQNQMEIYNNQRGQLSLEQHLDINTDYLHNKDVCEPILFFEEEICT